MRLFAFILLLLHVNFSMFIAQIDEKDIYGANFQQVQDINSLSDYLQHMFSHHKDRKKHKDTDDDNACYFHALKPHSYLVQPTAIARKESSLLLYKSIPLLYEPALASGFSNTWSPPPKA